MREIAILRPGCLPRPECVPLVTVNLVVNVKRITDLGRLRTMATPSVDPSARTIGRTTSCRICPPLHLLLTGTEPARRRRRRTRAGTDVTHPTTSVGEAIGYLRDRQITLTWDQAAGTLQAGAAEAAKTIIRKAS